MAERKFEVVGQTPEAHSDTKQLSVFWAVFKVLTQRTIADLFMLVSIALAFWIADSIVPNPTPTQIVTLSIFAVFVLAANFIVRKF